MNQSHSTLATDRVVITLSGPTLDRVTVEANIAGATALNPNCSDENAAHYVLLAQRLGLAGTVLLGDDEVVVGYTRPIL